MESDGGLIMLHSINTACRCLYPKYVTQQDLRTDAKQMHEMPIILL